MPDGRSVNDAEDGKPLNPDLFSGLADEINKSEPAKKHMELIRKRTVGQMVKSLKLASRETDKETIKEMIAWSTNFVIEQFKYSVTSLFDSDILTWKLFKQKVCNMYLTASALLTKIFSSNAKLDNDKLTNFELVKSFLCAIKDKFIEELMKTNIYRDWLRMLERSRFVTAIKIVIVSISVYQLYAWWTKPSEVCLHV